MPLQTDVEPDADYERLKNWIVKDTVIVNSAGKLYWVVKVNPKNYVCVDESGQGYNVRRTPSIKRAPRQDMWAGPKPEDAFTSDFKLGSPVRLKSAKNRARFGDFIYIIVAISSGNTFRLAKLGGTPNNSYLKNFMTTDLVLVKGTFQEED